jgi:hypothetical protein
MPETIKKSVEGKTDIILIWDSLTDVKMIDFNLRDNALKIGFLWNTRLASKDLFLDTFDIVVEDNLDSMWVPLEILKYINR